MADTVLGAELVAAYRAQMERLRHLTAAQVSALWDRLGSYNESDVPRWLSQVIPAMSAATTAAAQLTDGYIAAYLEAETGSPASPTGIVRPPVRPVDVDTEWRRPFIHTWVALEAGKDWLTAVDAGRVYAASTAATDTQVAARNTAGEAMDSYGPRVAGYRRVLGPGNNCGLCIVASTQRYGRSTLLPIHNRCGCTVEPIIGGPVGRVIDRGRLNLVKSQLRSEDLPYTRSALTRLRVDPADLPPVRVAQHGELGPVLTDARHRFDPAA